jgi:hypothetical protein
VSEGAVPVGEGAVPVGEEAVPVGEGAVPVGEEAVPVGEGAVPVGEEAAPVGEGAVPVVEGTVPVAEEEVAGAAAGPGELPGAGDGGLGRAGVPDVGGEAGLLRVGVLVPGGLPGLVSSLASLASELLPSSRAAGTLAAAASAPSSFGLARSFLPAFSCTVAMGPGCWSLAAVPRAA